MFISDRKGGKKEYSGEFSFVDMVDIQVRVRPRVSPPKKLNFLKKNQFFFSYKGALFGQKLFKILLNLFSDARKCASIQL